MTEQGNWVDRMTLANVQKGKQKAPFCVLLYGPEGIGKSTFAAGAPKPIFINEPGGTEELDVARFPTPGNWEEVFVALDELQKESHEYETLVLDTLDFLEARCWEHVCLAAKDGKRRNSIEDFGYAKGYVFALEEFQKLAARLELLRMQRRMNIVLLAHSHVKGFKNPIGDDYDTYELRLNGKLAEFMRAWPKAVLFANYRIYTNKSSEDGRIRGVSDGSRVIHSAPHPAWHAKSRYALPPELPLSWAEFERHAGDEKPESTVEAIAIIRVLLADADAETKAKAEESLKRNEGDARKLAVLKDWIIGKLNLKKGVAA